MAALALLVTAFMATVTAGGASAQTTSAACRAGDTTYRVVRGDTLGNIAARYHANWRGLATYNHIANPNLIYVNQAVCIPGNGNYNASAPTSRNTTNTTSSGTTSGYTAPGSAVGGRNVFPYPACTWWADQRYRQIHGVYVPWTTNAAAWQWTARAYQFGWHVSSRPSVGSIINLQPWVQGAYGGGHVAYVEQVLGNGHVIASNTSWGSNIYQVRYVEFAPGPGVTFIRQ